MATKKEVDLVIRARDQATGAVDSVTKAIESFVASQSGLQATGAKTDGTLAKIGASFADLNKALGGGGALGAVEKQLQSAAEGMARMERATAAATGEAIGYQREALQAARATQQLREESVRVAQAVEKQARAVEQARAAEAKLQTVTKSATADRARLVEADKRLTDQIEAQRLKLFLATAALREMNTELKNTTGPTEALETRMSSVSRSVRTAETALDELRTTQAVVRTSIEATARAVDQANQKYGATAGALKSQEAALASLSNEQRGLGASVATAAAAQSKLEASALSAARGLTTQDAALEATQQGYRDVQAEAGRMTTALSKLEQKARGPLLAAFGQQSRVVAELRGEFTKYQTEATRLGQAIAKVKNPSEAMVAAFGRSVDAAARARAAYRDQNGELGRLRQILRESGGDVDAFANRQARFADIQTRAARSFSVFRTEATAAAAAASRNAGASNTAAAAADRLARAQAAQAAAAARAAAGTNTLSGAIRSFYGESRTALSFTQRLRSEVLSLVAAYGGFFAVVGGIKQVVAAYQTLEAAQSRLNVVFDGNQVQTAQELDFLRRNAERLGVEFGVLAGEYGKFAVATKGTNLEGAQTRKIFISVAESARVNKLSMENLQGVFVALTQIVSKGTVSMEELKQQLGDRLPGAIQIMADAAGVGTDELIKMIEQGQLSSDVLSKFGVELDKRFGSQLPAALKTTTTELGRLQNAIFQAFLKVANGGFIERFTALVRDLNTTLASSEFESFLNRVSVALGAASDALAFLVRNFDMVVIAITAFIALKITPFVILLASRLGILTGSTVSATRGFRALYVAVNSGSIAMSRGAIAARAFTIALRSLLSATGIGLLVVGIGAAIGSWASSADEATEAMNAHAKTVDAVKNAYDSVGGSIDEMRQKLDGLTTTEARRNLVELEAAFTDTVAAFNKANARDGGSFATRFFGKNLGEGATAEYRAAIDKLVRQTKTGEVAIADLGKELDGLAEKYGDGSAANRRLADELDIASKGVIAQAKAIRDAKDVITVLTGSAEDAEAAIKRLTGATEENAKATLDTAKNLKEWGAALRALQDQVPSLAGQLEILDEKAKLKAALDAALQLARTYGQVAQALKLYEEGIDAVNGKAAIAGAFEGAPTGGLGAAFNLIALKEDFREDPYYDVNAYRAGYGSDTVTLADGTFIPVIKGMKVTQQQATDDLVRRIREFQNVIKGQIGESRFGNFNEQQQAALTSLAYNYGSLPGRILEAARSGSADDLARAIEGLKGDNKGINSARRQQEADIIRGSGAIGIAGSVAADEERVKAAEKAAELAKSQAEATAETLETGKFELAQQALINAGKEREAAIQAAITAARKENPNISEAELETIRRQTAELYDQQNLGKEKKESLEAAEKAEQRVNEILEKRTALQEQLAAAIKAGSGPETTDPIKASLEAVNGELSTAIEQALELYRALGLSEPAIAAAVAKLETLKIASTGASNRVVLDWKLVEQQFASNLVTAFDNFSQAVAEGQSVGEAARNAFLQFASDFLKQIAQMILQQVALNIARGVFGSLGLGGTVGVGLAHTGAIAGQRGAARQINPAVFAGAMRYHTGGIAGLAPNEVPTILQRNEEILTTGDPRHIFNQGKGAGGAGGEPKLKVVNGIDSASFLEAALNTSVGEKVLLNWLQANSDAVSGSRG